jgi:hypothetical protein
LKLAIKPERRRIVGNLRTKVTDTQGRPIESAVAVISYEVGKRLQTIAMPAANRAGSAIRKMARDDFDALRKTYKSPPAVTLDGRTLRVVGVDRAGESERLLAITIVVEIAAPDRPVRSIIRDQHGNPVRNAIAVLAFIDRRKKAALEMPSTDPDGGAKISIAQAGFDALRKTYSGAAITLRGKALRMLDSRVTANSDDRFVVEHSIDIPEPELEVRSTVTDQNGRPVANAVVALPYKDGDRTRTRTLPATGADGSIAVKMPQSQFEMLRKGYQPPPSIKQGSKRLNLTKSTRPTNNTRLLVFHHRVMIPEHEPENALVSIFITDREGNPVPGAMVAIKRYTHKQVHKYEMPASDGDGHAEVHIKTDLFEVIRKDYMEPPDVLLDGSVLEVLRSQRSTNNSKMMRVAINVALPAPDEPPVTPDQPPVIPDGPPLPNQDGPFDDADKEAVQPTPNWEETEMSKAAKRLFRFNAVRPVIPQKDNGMEIEYRGELTPFLKQLQTRSTRGQARSLATDEIAKRDFFKADRFENTAYWPLISSMKRAYTMTRMEDIAEIKSELADAFADHATPKQLDALMQGIGEIWDHYIISLLLTNIADKKQAALVDCIKAVELYRLRQSIRSADDFRKLLVKRPVLPEWLIRLVGGDFRLKFPFVIGVTDLMVVKEEWIGYQRTEIAHIENVMATEERTTTRRQLDRTETTTTYETERIEEALKETSSSIHSAMSQEVESTISQSASFSTGATVSASYGPAVSVDTNASFDFTTASEETTSSAQEYAQDLVERAVSTVSNRERNETVTVVLAESEDTHVQTFKNSEPGAENVIGVYRHIDQIWRAQVFNYGKRLMLDLVIPEPSVNWRLSREEDSLPDSKLQEPTKLNLNPSGIDVGNYQSLGNTWGASRVPAPPDTVVSVSKSMTLEVPKFGTGEATSSSMATAQVQIPEGYRGEQAVVNFFGDSKKENNDNKDDAKVLINGVEKDIESGSETVALNNHVGTLEFGVYIDFFEGGVVTVRVDCRVSPEAWAEWQNSVYEALKAANDKAIDAYNAAKKSKDALKNVQQETLHPDIKRNIERMEVKRSVISLLASDNYEESGSVDLVKDGALSFPSIRFEEARREGAYARFFEEAFEWPEMTYLYYPYFWARRSEWYKLMNQKDPDFNFNAFLQSGAARVNLAVRPGFESAVMWFLATGEVWKGGPTPTVGDPLYVALIDEIVESKGRDLDKPLPVGKPWTYAIPTSLVVLDPDDSIVPPADGSVTEA